MDERRWQDIFQEMLEASDLGPGDDGTRESEIDKLIDMLIMTQQLRKIGLQEMPDAQGALARARERVLQSVDEPTHVSAPGPFSKHRLKDLWQHVWEPMSGFSPAPLAAAMVVFLALGIILYSSINAAPGSPLYPVRHLSESAMDLLRTDADNLNTIAEIPAATKSEVIKSQVNRDNVNVRSLPLTRLSVALSSISHTGQEAKQLASPPGPTPIWITLAAASSVSSSHRPPIVLILPPATPLPVTAARADNAIVNPWPAPPVIAGARTSRNASVPMVAHNVSEPEQTPTQTQPRVVAQKEPAATKTGEKKKSATKIASQKNPTSTKAPARKKKSSTKAAKKKRLTPTRVVAKKKSAPTRAATHESPSPTAAISPNTPSPQTSPSPNTSTPVVAIAVEVTATKEISGPMLIAGAPASASSDAGAKTAPAATHDGTATKVVTATLVSTTPEVMALVAASSTPESETQESGKAAAKPEKATVTATQAPAATKTKTTKSTATPKAKTKAVQGKIAQIRWANGKIKSIRVGGNWYAITSKTVIKGKLKKGRFVQIKYVVKQNKRVALKITVKNKTQKYKSTGGKIRRIYKVKGKVRAVLIGRYWYTFTSKTKVKGKVAVGKRAVVQYYPRGWGRYVVSIVLDGSAKKPVKKKATATSAPSPTSVPTATSPATPNPTSTSNPTPANQEDDSAQAGDNSTVTPGPTPAE